MLETPILRSKEDNPAFHRAKQILSNRFVFVPITQGEAAKGRGTANSIVGAHVTRVQHARSSTLSGFQDIQNWTVTPYVHRGRTAGRRSRRKVGAAEELRAKQHEILDENNDVIGVSKKALPVLAFGSAGEDPFWSYPVEYQPYLSPIFGHYIQDVAVENPDLDGPYEKGLLRRHWFPLAITEAATMFAVLLMAASHYCIVNPSQAELIDLLALKAGALSEINIALASQNRAVTNALIGAVAKMAAYEAVFGDSEVFGAHMKGLQTMLRLRVEVSTLGLNGLLEGMLVLIDLNAAHLTGTAVALGGEASPTIVRFTAPDPHHLAGLS